MKSLRLTIYEKYFYQIVNKDKTIEYREIKDYWTNILTKKHYDSVLFVNGYGHERPYCLIELKRIVIGNKFYELHLGNILEVGNLKEDINNDSIENELDFENRIGKWYKN